MYIIIIIKFLFLVKKHNILDLFNEFKLNIFDNINFIVKNNYNSSIIKFDLVIYNIWSSKLTDLWKKFKNIIFIKKHLLWIKYNSISNII